ncbi:HD domain-containing phosphohydrolase [Uliginosibacterium aquaticum]|uniref:HD domain-containing protein n=1 Tax=Uliginosibacterium aquaticum TaxID=2731212 RepID=A0ABX2ICB1_9RHOO|nr:HD domain-containing phosphohydrolase [Uliginosibacterium aquaticum]NSL54154.1 HD domain-containing protein [Uliginosibacterium aquaticum]
MNERGEHGHLRLPLHVLAAAGMALLLVLMAAVLVVHSYYSTRAVASSAVNESIRHVSRSLTEKLRGILQPAENQLELLSFSEIVRARTLSERLLSVGMAQAALKANPLLDAWYVGYPGGDFILFRPLREARLRESFQAPVGASLLVQSRSNGPGGRPIGEFLFYNAAGHLLRREERPAYSFDPRSRPWFIQAEQQGSGASIITDPYLFFTTRQPGVTLARLVHEGGPVVGADATLRELGKELGELKLSPGTQVAIIDASSSTVALEDARRSAVLDASRGEARLARLGDLGLPALVAAARLPASASQRSEVQLGRETWELISVPIELHARGKALRVLMAVPGSELFGEAQRLLWRQLWVILALVLGSIPLCFWLTQRVVRPLRDLAEEARAVTSFDFRPSRLKRSRIAEVDLLTSATGQMRATISRFLEVNSALNSQIQLEQLLGMVLDDVLAAVQARSGALYLFDPDSRTLSCSQQRGEGMPPYPLRLALEADAAHPVVQVALSRQSVIGMQGERGSEVFAVALETFERNFVGVLVLESSRPLGRGVGSLRDPQLAFVEALSSTAAVAIETRSLVESQKCLLDAIIKLLAGAIDAKSPYTGGHCQRVPELTLMLAEAAHASEEGALREFRLSVDEREAVRIAAWLHDCGKLTTPEYVVDKATKLETLYNRIHEIRTRFELLKRDAELAFWRARSPSAPTAQELAALQAEWQSLDDEFAFVAACNQGGEYLDAERIARLESIGARTWLRTLDDRLGLSREEAQLLAAQPVARLPATERLLADKPEHLVARPPSEQIAPDNPWGFHMDVPAARFNRGELHNLCVSRGTLTEEERYIINAHIVQTIVMLGDLPFPRHLRAVPEIAGSHHERMDGKGYPRRLTGSQMSVPARIMAIADVFEALTAADRPYKAPKTLSEALQIMARMVAEGHLDAELFALFVRSGVYLDYAGRYLRAEQIDSVDPARLGL